MLTNDDSIYHRLLSKRTPYAENNRFPGPETEGFLLNSLPLIPPCFKQVSDHSLQFIRIRQTMDFGSNGAFGATLHNRTFYYTANHIR